MLQKLHRYKRIVTDAALDSKINDLKVQHTADEVKKVDDKTKKNASNILRFESRLKQKEDIADDGQRENSFTWGFYHYLQKSYLVYECRTNSFKKNTSDKSTTWKSAGIDNLSAYSHLKATSDGTLLLPTLENYGRMSLKFNGSYFVQNKVLHPNNNVVNIYIVYKLDTINNTRNTDYTIKNALFGAVKIIKNSDISKNKCEGYGICFDEGGTLSHTVKEGNFDHTTLARNALIFGADMIFSSHANNKANNIYVMGKDIVQGINDTTLYAEKEFRNNFTEPGKKFELSLHYNFSNSYLFVNGTQELKYKSKADQILKEKLCVGNLSSDWTVVDSTKTGLYGNVYDFVVDYQGINGVKQIYDMHTYLMKKMAFNYLLCKNDANKFIYNLFQCIKSKFFRMYIND